MRSKCNLLLGFASARSQVGSSPSSGFKMSDTKSGNVSHSRSSRSPMIRASSPGPSEPLSPKELMGLGLSPEVYKRRQTSRTPGSITVEPVELPAQRFSWFSMIWATEPTEDTSIRDSMRGRPRGPRLHTRPKVADLRSEAAQNGRPRLHVSGHRVSAATESNSSLWTGQN